MRLQEIVSQGLSVHAVDAELLCSHQRDLTLTSQCAPLRLQTGEALDSWTGIAPQHLLVAPDNLPDVWDDSIFVNEPAGVQRRPMLAFRHCRRACML